MGATLLGVGLVLTLMGIMLFFEGNLLRLGNVRILILLACMIPLTMQSYIFFCLFGCLDWDYNWSVLANRAKQSGWILSERKSDTSNNNNFNRYELILSLYASLH